jgi:hypothetical protein
MWLNCLCQKSEALTACKCAERVLKGANREDKDLYKLND